MTEVTLAVGEDHVVSLEDRGGAGYIWTASVAGDAVALTAETSEAPPRATSGPEPPDTYGTMRIFTLTARAPGRATATFALVRPWENGAKPLETRVLELRVLKNDDGQ